MELEDNEGKDWKYKLRIQQSRDCIFVCVFRMEFASFQLLH